MSNSQQVSTNGSTDSLRSAVMEQLAMLAEDETLAHVATITGEYIRRLENGQRAYLAGLQREQRAA